MKSKDDATAIAAVLVCAAGVARRKNLSYSTKMVENG